MKLTPHEQKILKIVKENPKVIDQPAVREKIAKKYGLTEKTLRNRIAELRKRGLLPKKSERNPIEKKPLIIGVTLLTSLDQKSVDLIGFKGNLDEIVVNLALLAKNSGLDGVVCSPREIKLIRKYCGEDFIIITPGIRFEQSIKDDQVRTLSPFEAQARGANILVIGRPITKSKDPLATTKEIIKSLKK